MSARGSTRRPRRRLEAAALAFLLLRPAGAGAVYTSAQIDHVDSEALFGPSYFVDLLSYDYPAEWQDVWRSTDAPSYRVTAGSLDCCDLTLNQDVRLARRLVDGLTFRYALVQRDDKDLQDFHQWLELEQRVGGGFSALLFGEPTFRKEDSDIGLGLAWRGGPFSLAARHYFVDFNFNQRGHTTERFRSAPATDQATASWSDGGREVSAFLEYDAPTVLSIPDVNRVFSYRRTTAGAWARAGPPGGWSVRGEYAYQFQDKGDLYTPDPAGATLDNRRQVHRARLALEGPAGPRDRLEAGLVYLSRAARSDASDDAARGVFYRRWELQPYARWRRTLRPWLAAELAAFLSAGENRARHPGRPERSGAATLVEGKLGTGAEFVFGPRGRLELYPTWDLDEPLRHWGGGNVRAIFFF